MTAYSLKFAQDNLERIARETVQNSDETIITLDSGEAVVLIPLDQYEAWKETQLLAHPANRRHLLESMEQYRQGRKVPQSLAALQAGAPE
ncbi:type II toxin-antitoxin system Phd/YefM family antitoxin [Deinococcus arcticus]|uniref:Antitoxin n=1 Tax=Deinococcus arcticus TaxID=2136176 RepID=A0A2T3W7Y0_9DEIO|nr:type II toxin-antitoxin system Phd/YefM family antitoxin [Deinococcus arcticus]PTA68015.1 type II toxin-antitoxin system prevent-host-death family antitoxin [Deinococcus arcticus]